MKIWPWAFAIVFVLTVAVVALRAYYSRRTFILCYHKIAPFRRGGLKSLFVRPRYFAAQMGYLKLRGYRTVSLPELAGIISSGQKLPPKIFAITFDDGYRDNYTSAYPTLKKNGFRATVFLMASAVGQNYAYPGEPAEEHLSPEEIRLMSDIIDFGAHTLSHPRLADVSDAQVAVEVSGSKKALKDKAGVDAVTFCYPFGSCDERSVALARSDYVAACTTRPGLVSAGADPHLLPRVEFKDLFTMSFRDFFRAFEFYLKIALGA
ncbi:MAG: polysaccharide deacetylase [Elusimicrobia bacterium HGW-Elusimicrobia-1]|jgi:peptidoglycan/xylan/chitin deacetylase (PgdA/CDA1 family)|nr:MAG: polysaccharide deacetylase [Elusimicrobia bacterium HGW-Elusimicrobia-1]